ncbi:MAG: hypothetical protein ACLR4Z_06260 [Butyricicoccaceae bacterium]
MSRVESHPLSGNGQRPPYPLGRAAIRASVLSRSCVLSAAGCWRSARSAVLTHYGLFAPSAIRRTVQYALAGARQHEGDITNIEFENNIFSDGALFESGLAYADSDALYLSRPGSMTTFQVTIGYSIRS